ncbi:MAG: hypothetical protein ABR604_04040 [Jatrophihabitantaceae bacterium]
MPTGDALSAAIEELFSLDPAEFTQRRKALAGRARHDGDVASARAITALRRPTKAAWIINRLVRAEPDVASELCELGTQLGDAQRSLDGARLRELTQQRRQLIDAVARKAFDLGAPDDPPAALRHEVVSTLEAALADPAVAAQLTTGTLRQSAQWSGFGESGTVRTAVRTPRPARRPVRAPAKMVRRTTPSAGASALSKRAGSAPTRAEQRPRQRVTQAEAVLAAASSALQAAVTGEQEQHQVVALLTEELADARHLLDKAKLQTRQARARHREAERGLGRARR